MIFHDPGQERKLGQYINKHARHPKFTGSSFPAELYPILLAILKKAPFTYFFRYKNFHRHESQFFAAFRGECRQIPAKLNQPLTFI
jgi:hypothetical protein